MNKEILIGFDLKGIEIGSGCEYGIWNVDGNGYGYGELYEYFKILKIDVPYYFPTSVLNYCNETIDNYE